MNRYKALHTEIRESECVLSYQDLKPIPYVSLRIVTWSFCNRQKSYILGLSNYLQNFVPQFYVSKSILWNTGSWILHSNGMASSFTGLAMIFTAWKVSVFGVILVRIFLNSDWVSLRIQSECRKAQIRITPNTDTFYTVIFLRAR